MSARSSSRAQCSILLAICAAAGVAGALESESHGAASRPSLRALSRSVKAVAAPVEAPVRDPFFTAASGTPTPRPKAVPIAAAASPSVPPAALSIIGKLHDEHGWAVFVAQPESEASKGDVWVVRQGETFAENLRVIRLAPPVLIIGRGRGRDTTSFDIGSAE